MLKFEWILLLCLQLWINAWCQNLNLEEGTLVWLLVMDSVWNSVLGVLNCKRCNLGNNIERHMHTTVNVAWSKNLTLEEGELLWVLVMNLVWEYWFYGFWFLKMHMENDLEELGCVGVTCFMVPISGFWHLMGHILIVVSHVVNLMKKYSRIWYFRVRWFEKMFGHCHWHWFLLMHLFPVLLIVIINIRPWISDEGWNFMTSSECGINHQVKYKWRPTFCQRWCGLVGCHPIFGLQSCSISLIVLGFLGN